MASLNYFPFSKKLSEDIIWFYSRAVQHPKYLKHNFLIVVSWTSKLIWKLPAFADQIWSSLLAELLKDGFRSESGKEEEKSKSGDSTWCRWPHTSEFHRQCKRKKDFLRQKYKIQNLVEWAWENRKIDKIKRQKCPPQIGWMGWIVKASRCRKEANSTPREGNGRSGPTGSTSLLLYNFCKSSLI